MSDSIAVTGIGAITALGGSAQATFDALLAGRRGLGALDLFVSTRYLNIPVAQIRTLTPAEEAVSPSRTEQLALKASREALAQAGHDEAGLRKHPERWGVFAGTTVAGMLATETYFQKKWTGQPAQSRVLRHHAAASLSQFLARQLNMQGWVTTLSTACSSGLNALVSAAEMIQDGRIDKALVVGADSLARIVVNGFGSLLIVDAQGARPFDRDRRGLTLGEGAGALVLEKAGEENSGKKILATLLGWGNTCDAYHATAPEPQGAGACDAMALAVAQAGIGRQEIDYINAHGTGTPDNDQSESRAVARFFGDRPIPALSSVKGALGHTLGAAGAIESVVCIMTMASGKVPGTIGCEHPDETLPVRPLLTVQEQQVRYALNNSFGFGGNNTSVLFAAGGRS